MTTTEEALKTAHIHLDQATFRVYVKNSDVFPFEEMNDDPAKPRGIQDVHRSADPARNKTSIMVFCTGELPDLTEVAKWISSYEPEEEK